MVGGLYLLLIWGILTELVTNKSHGSPTSTYDPRTFGLSLPVSRCTHPSVGPTPVLSGSSLTLTRPTYILGRQGAPCSLGFHGPIYSGMSDGLHVPTLTHRYILWGKG